MELMNEGLIVFDLEAASPEETVSKIAGVMEEQGRLNGNEIVKETDLTPKDEREIGRDLDRIMDEIENNVDGPLYYNGEPIDDESLELLRKALELGLTQLKRENKVKYNPNKNKKR